MPEKELGQHAALATDLITSSAGIHESMSLLFYLISNNLTSGDFEDHFVAMERVDKLMLQILKDTGWDDLRYLEFLVTSHEPTAESVAERVFAAALRERSMDIIQKMLRSGMRTNGLIENRPPGDDDEIFYTPLQCLVQTDEGAQLIHLLISHGADVDFSIEKNGKNALYWAIQAENQTAIRILLDLNATVTWQCASLAASFEPDSIEHFSLHEKIIDIYLDQDMARQRDDTETLEMAVWNGNLTMVERFVSTGTNLNGLIEIHLDTEDQQTTLLGLAAYGGNMGLVRLLLHVSTREDISSKCTPYVSPLEMAVRRGLIDICEVLISSGSDKRAADEGEKTLLERAVPNNNLALCQMLINYGAKIDRDPEEYQIYPSALMLAVQHGLVDVVDLLIGSNARLNDTFEAGPETILAAAIEVGDVAILQKLQDAGATKIGLNISKIGTCQTAIFLREKMILPKILEDSGPEILAAAILAKQNDLAWFILQNDVHMKWRGRVHYKKSPLRAALQRLLETDNSKLVLALLVLDVCVTDDDLTAAILVARIDLLPSLLVRFTGSAPTAISVAILTSSMACLDLFREANIDFRGTPQMSHHRWHQARPLVEAEFLHSILEVAAWKANEFIFKYLLEWAVSVRIDWSRESVARALTLAIFEQKHEHTFDLMRLDSDLNCSITIDRSISIGKLWIRKGHAYTPLQAAVKTQQVSVVRDLLVLKRADVNYLGHGIMRRTPLQHAVELGKMEIFNLLIEHGANVNGPAAEDGGATALQLAAIKGYIGIVRTLLQLGADVNQEPAPKNGRTALMGAAEHGRIDILQMLLDKMALVGSGDDDYSSEAVTLAEGRGHYAAARLLKRFKSPIETE
ncbi:hypothetical protein PENSTE_c005G08639 [Penicillium steckii]|uniref:Uncharacterized protein n=1 Tax=Penicillium steckii TaxID=303698 RepID=A0A1V6TIY2_9EURO|nr:hypothetical protein PENSTE_c005G08639 [Penicillium steckii]